MVNSHKFFSASIKYIIGGCHLFIRIKNISARSSVNFYKLSHYLRISFVCSDHFRLIENCIVIATPDKECAYSEHSSY